MNLDARSRPGPAPALPALVGCALIALAACGGAQDEPLSTMAQSGQSEVAHSAAALQQYERERPFKSARASLPGGLIGAEPAAVPRSCAQRLHAKLSDGMVEGSEPFDCLVGQHHGLDLQGRGCSLRIDPVAHGFRFFRQPAGALIVAAEESSGPQGLVLEHRLSATDVDTGALGLRLRREDRRPDGVRETLVLGVVPQADGRDLLHTMSFERVQAGTVQIQRCRFAG
jgi:hypothetical protein